MGYRPDAHFLTDMNSGGATTQNFYAGQRVVCVWDRRKTLLLAARVDVNHGGTIRLRRPATYSAAPTSDGARAEYRVENALPLLAIGN